MFDYKVKIGLVPMRRDTNNRPKGTFLTWYSAEERGERFVKYIEENFTTDKVSFVDSKGLGTKDLIHDAAPFVRFVAGKRGTIVGTGSDVSDHTPVPSPDRRMRAGRIAVAVRVGNVPGTLTLRAEADGLTPAELAIELK